MKLLVRHVSKELVNQKFRAREVTDVKNSRAKYAESVG